MALIELRNLSKTYELGEVKVAALRQVNLDICDGEFVALIGPSGSGKSTLMNTLGCLDRPNARGATAWPGQAESPGYGRGPDQLGAGPQSAASALSFQNFKSAVADNLHPRKCGSSLALQPSVSAACTKATGDGIAPYE